MSEQSSGGSVPKAISGALYADVKGWLVSTASRVAKLYADASMRTFASPAELSHAVAADDLKDGQAVRVDCKIAPMGPFLSSHFLLPLIGSDTSMRLGPPLASANPIMAMMAQATSHLMPVGLYPSIAPEVEQVRLYPPNATACGFVGLFPGVNEVVHSLPALSSTRHSGTYYSPVQLTGRVRKVDALDLAEAGVVPEVHEGLRRAGQVWFVDATEQDSNATPLTAEEIPDELWGGLYAAGHLEIASGELDVATVVDCFTAALAEHDFAPSVTQNLAAGQEYMVFAKGCRAQVASKSPFYSLHMDTEFSREFVSSRQRFDSMTAMILDGLSEVCTDADVALENPVDLDLTYTNGTDLYSVLRSAGAEAIQDPVAVVIRDWHRRRGRAAGDV